MKALHVFYTVLVLMVGAALAYCVVQGRQVLQMRQRYDSTYKVDLAAISFVARVNYMRAKWPNRSVDDILDNTFPAQPTGFTVRRVAWTKRDEASWLHDADFVVEQTAPPWLVITSTGSLWHRSPPQAGNSGGQAVEWNPPHGPAGMKIP